MEHRTRFMIAAVFVVAVLTIVSVSGCNVPDIPFLSKKTERSQEVTYKVIPEAPIPSVDESTGAQGEPVIIKSEPLTLNKTGQAGCLVCHADKKAIMVVKGKVKSIYIDQDILERSPHKDIGCLDCHIDFSYTHDVKQASYKKVAGLACKNCHDHDKENKDYRQSAHGKKALAGNDKAATCADCHGSHQILKVKSSKKDKKKFRTQAKEVCGQCHEDYWDSYNDYYHGRAYKRGAEDAPPCWDCHDTHKILAAKNSASTVAAGNIGSTCGACHPGSTNKMVEYVPLIHGKKTERAKNIVFKYVDKGIDYLKPPQPIKKTDEVSKEGKSKENAGALDVIKRVRSLFFPESLRPKD